MSEVQPAAIAIGEGESVSGLLQAPANARAGCVLAHGAGAGMNHPFMAAVAQGLAARGISTLRYEFPYMERGSKRPDVPRVAHAAVRAAVAHAVAAWPGLPLFAGGKSFGARMSSQAQAASPLAQVRGLVFIGFPLHPAKQPGDERAKHLDEVQVPMLFLQGSRDDLADAALVRALVERLGTRATLVSVDQADHSFHVPAKSGRNDVQVMEQLLDEAVRWMQRVG